MPVIHSNKPSSPSSRRVRRVGQSVIVIGLGVVLPYSDAKADYFLSNRTEMRVARHTGTASIPFATHDVAFQNASTALLTDNDGAAFTDYACPLTLAAHSFYTFSGGNSDDDVDNQTEYQGTQLNASGAYYNVVDTINWCGTTGAVGGCGWPQGGQQPFIATRALAVSAQRGNVVAHEFGHTIGLGHDSTGTQVMAPGVLSTANNKVSTPGRCESFRTVFTPDGCTDGLIICSTQIEVIDEGDDLLSATSFAGRSMSAASVFEPMSLDIDTLPPERHEEMDLSSVSITQLLDWTFDRIPAEAEDYYGDQEVVGLSDIIRSRAERDKHRAAVSLVGLISTGAESDVQLLDEYLGGVDADVAAAMMALGYIVNRHGSEEAWILLADHFLDGPHSDEAALGLTVSGDPAARALLEDAVARTKDPKKKVTLSEQASENARIEQVGGIREHYLNPPSAKWLDVPATEAGFAAPESE